MNIIEAIGGRELFAQGDVACAYGALLGGCTFFAGYPITPATEVAEAMSRLLPKVKGERILQSIRSAQADGHSLPSGDRRTLLPPAYW